jgi:chromosome segregation ATPase
LVESIVTPRGSVKDHYDQVLNSFELYQRERLLALKQGLAKILNDLDGDEVIRTLREDPNSASFAYQRMREVLDNALIAENEQQIQTIRGENLILKEQLAKATQKTGQLELEVKCLTERHEGKTKALETKKERYKEAANQCQKEIEQLSKRMRDLNT